MNAYSVTGTMSGTWDIAENETDKNKSPSGMFILVGLWREWQTENKKFSEKK